MTQGELYNRKDIANALDEAKRNFPIEFKWYETVEDKIHGEILQKKPMPNAKLPENRANAFVDPERTLDWFLKYFGSTSVNNQSKGES
jgi:hypothetical protein